MEERTRVMDGLDGAAAFAETGLERREMDRILGGLESRTFLLNNVHEDGPVLFQTRWAMSYLRGSMARPEIRRLMESRRTVTPARDPEAGPGTAPSAPSTEPAIRATRRPVVPPGVEEVFVRAAAATGPYRPALLAEVDLHYSRSGLGLETWQRVVCLAPLPAEVPPNP